VTEDEIRGTQSLMTGTEMVPETLVYLLLKHLKWLVAQESFTHVYLWVLTYWELCSSLKVSHPEIIFIFGHWYLDSYL